MQTPSTARIASRPVTIFALCLLASACSAGPSSPSTPATSPQAQPTPTVSSAIDVCLIGTWSEVRYESFIDLTGVDGAAATVVGAGRTLEFAADGTETVDYGSGVTMTGVSQDGVVVESTYSGRVVLRVTTVDGTMSFVPVTDEVDAVYRSGGRVVATGAFGSPAPVSYTCTGDRMTQSMAPTYSAEYERASPGA